MNEPALADTGFLLAVWASNDTSHIACSEVAMTERNVIIPSVVLPELAYMAIRDVGRRPYIHLMRMMLADNPNIVDATPTDLLRAIDLMEQYADAHIDLVDCTIIAIAERLNIKRILTVDQKDFRMVRPQHIPTFTILP